MSAKPLHVAAESSGFGARVTGLDLSKPLPEVTLAELRKAWAEHAVLSFPGQPLAHEELEAFSRQIGPFGVDPFADPIEGHPHILEVRRNPDEQVTPFGAAWHSDWSFQERPPSATILHAKVVPPAGGDTWYADTCRAWEALSPTMQGMLEGLRVRHSAGFAYGPKGVLAKDNDKRSMKIRITEEALASQIHPLVRTHPVTGRKALFVNPVYTVAIEGLTKEENFALLSFLYGHMAKDEFVYRHRWEPDMLTMWDNRCANHLATGGYDGHLRVMHRTTVAGDVPA
jgi:taurine dioxygenase